MRVTESRWSIGILRVTLLGVALLQPLGIHAQVDDPGLGGNPDDSALLAIAVANVDPVISISGSTTTAIGQVYSLDLTATEPGTDTVSTWIVNWGDGTIDTYDTGVTNPMTVEHTYTQTGLT